MTKIPTEYRATNETIIEMNFKGKVKGGSGRNAAGWERNASKYFKELYNKHPEYFDAENVERIFELDRVPKVNEQFLKYFPQYKKYKDSELRHHHAGEGGQAYAIPAPLHPGHGGVHNYEKSAGVRGNDPLTERAQAIEITTRNEISEDQKNNKNKRSKKCEKK